MAPQTVITLHHKICENIRQGYVSLAFCTLDTLLQDLREWWANSRKEELRTLYVNMLQCQVQQIIDPEQERIYARFISDLYVLVDQVREALLTRESNTFEYVQKRQSHDMVVNWGQLMEQSHHYVKLLTMADEDQVPAEQLRRYSSMQEQRRLWLFNYLWMSNALSAEEQRHVVTLLEDGDMDMLTRCVAVSGLTLSLLRCFDADKMLLLINQAGTNEEVEVRQRAMVGMALVMVRFGSRINCCAQVRQALLCYNENATFNGELENVLLQIIRTSETERVTQRIRNDIMPTIMRLSPVIQNHIEELKDDDEDRNPEWGSLIDSEASAKLQEFGEMQMSGADVYMSTFAALKNFPFFNDTMNWLLPFSMLHSHIASVFGTSNASDVLTLFLKSPQLCNSDKYSFCLNLKQMPESQRHIMVQAANGEAEQLHEMLEEAKKQSIKLTAQNVANQYIQDLYRFYTLHPCCKELVNPLPAVLEVYRLPFFEELFADWQTRRRIAGYLFSKDCYAEAQEMFERLITQTDNVSYDLYQKIGFCAQKIGDFAKAIRYYTLANDLQTGSWILCRLAYCCKKTGDYAGALNYYRQADKLEVDNLKITRHIGVCCAEMGNYTDALAAFYKMDYLSPDNVKTWHLIAWCALMAHKPEQAAQQYDKILKGQPTDLDWLNAGHVQMALGQQQQALIYYKVAFQKATSPHEFVEHFVANSLILRQYGIMEERINLLINVIVIGL